MSLTVTVMFADGSSIGPNVVLQLLNAGVVADTETTNTQGVVTFNVDPTTLTSPAINLAPVQPPPQTAQARKAATSGSKTKKGATKKRARVKR